MYLIETLRRARHFETVEEVKDCCINITTEFAQYNFCFIEFETDEYLGIYYTSSDFTERFVLLSKEYIVSVSIVYKDDIHFEELNTDQYV